MEFTYQNPTKLIFGNGMLEQLGQSVSPYGKKALLVTGGGSVKRTGTFERALKSLAAAGVRVEECEGIEPNPRLSSVERGVAIAHRTGCDTVIALGGGSAMDAAKVIAAGVHFEGDLWDMFLQGKAERRLPETALPIITVPTLAATGSEMNPNAVITNEQSMVKSFVSAPCLYPKTAIVDPSLTASVPPEQTAYGVCDLLTHVTESYFNGVDGTPLQDRFAEGVILTALAWGPKAIANGEDLEARGQVQWASIVALNGWVQAGTLCSFPVHMIEHSLSAHHDIAHGAGLAIVNPGWMRFAAKFRPERFAQFAEKVFGIRSDSGEKSRAASEGIDRFEAFLKSTGCPTRLSEAGIDGSLLTQYAKDTLLVAGNEQGLLGGRPNISEQEIVEILRSVL